MQLLHNVLVIKIKIILVKIKISKTGVLALLATYFYWMHLYLRFVGKKLCDQDKTG